VPAGAVPAGVLTKNAAPVPAEKLHD
jgi:hypothetical protein